MGNDFIKIDNIEVAHCLRPEFTRYIINILINRRMSINLIGKMGTGKSRLLEDICQCRLPGVQVVYVDMRSYVDKYQSLLREIQQKLELGGDVPLKLGQLFTGLEKRRNRYVIILGNYDALLDNPDMNGNYDVDFFDDLNFIKNKNNVSLLCSSCCAHNTLPVFIDRKSFRNSWLVLEKIHLPKLTIMQINDELDRQLFKPHRNWLDSTPNARDKLVSLLSRHHMSYELLIALARQINYQSSEDQEIKFKRRLRSWKKDFDRDRKFSLNKRIHIARKKIDGTKISAGDPKLKIPVLTNLTRWINKWCQKK